ncbi:DKNYY domain-containing protein [Bacteroidales bacterium OttesenSCG-928-B11]|nr:DKNYY domain-containing protein [Bacteroidales bacterium OttesenSCG-928-C03]MDL2311874.1 DKNYY domain-containing protein [Bacteroidales bacterium OttesenSCG-928-B11]
MKEFSVSYQTHFLWKTEDKLFIDTIDITGDIDLPTFRLIAFGDYPDKKKGNTSNSNYQNPKSRCSDPSHFDSFHTVGYDKNYIYTKWKITLYRGDTLRPINRFLTKTSTKVLTLPEITPPSDKLPKIVNRPPVVIYLPVVQPHIDAETIEPLSEKYAMDKNFIYYKNKILPIAPENFGHVKVWEHSGDSYISDGIHVYENETLILGFDAKTFGVLSNSYCLFDKNGIYINEWNAGYKKIPFSYTEDVSEKNIFAVKNDYIIYTNQVYDISEKKIYKNLTKAQIGYVKENKFNLHTRMVKEKVYSMDGQLYKSNGRIYWGDKITMADAQAFECIPGSSRTIYDYYKDKKYAYRYCYLNGLTPIKGLDPKTAFYFDIFFADKDYVYCRDTRILKNENMQLLYVYTVLGRNPEYYIFKNSEGFWLIDEEGKLKVRKMKE